MAAAANASGPINVAICVDVFLEFAKTRPKGAVLYWNGVVGRASPPVEEALWRMLYIRISEAERWALFQSHEGSVMWLKTRWKGTMRPTIPATPFIATHQEYDFYSSIALQRGTNPARGAVRSGKTVLVALRKNSSTLANKGKGSYDDKIVVLNGSGYTRHASSFVACTEPGAQYSQRAAAGAKQDKRYQDVKFRKSEGVDRNADGIKDAGRLLEGTYLYYEKKGGHLKDRAFEVKTKQVAERDTDGDGRFTAQDPNRIDAEGPQTSMYIHHGDVSDVLEPNTWSAGCQTIPKNHYKTFLSAVGKPSSFYYVLVNAND